MVRLVVAKNRLPYPPLSGTDVVTYNFLRAAATGHDVVLVSLLSDRRQLGYADALAAIGVRLRPVLMPNRVNVATRALYRGLYGVASAVTFTPRERWYFNPPPFVAAVREEAARADVVQFEYWYLAWTARQVPAPRKVLLAHDAEFISNQLLVNLDTDHAPPFVLKRRALNRARWEKDACAAFDHVLCLSADDAHHLRPWCRRPPQVVFPIVDIPAVATPNRDGLNPILLYAGGTTRPENHHGLAVFLREIFPAIKRDVPGVRLVIRGERPRPLLRTLIAGDAAVSYLPPAADITPDWAAATVAVVPLWAGAGIKIKILTALAHGVPVVTTPVGAAGIPAREEDGLTAATTTAAFAEAVVALLTRPALWLARSRGGRAFSLRATNPDARNAEIVRLYENLARY